MLQYQNGNSTVELHHDGTRVISFEDTLQLEYPLNIDIRVSTACSLGYNPKTGKATCIFCHESARTDGTECDYQELKNKLQGLPKGIELAIGGNKITLGLIEFLTWAKNEGYICNLTVNQLHMNKERVVLKSLLEDETIYGLGISYRKDYLFGIDDYFVEHPRVVLHVIAGIDDVDDIINNPIKKVLVLGYKTFGFGVDYYSDEVKKNIQQWYWWIKKVIDAKDIVSFDNLGLEQLNIKRFLTEDKWEEFNQGEHSFYINAVDNYFAPSSRSGDKTNWNEMTIQNYFKQIESNG
jgi:hypothetical protein